MKDTKYKVSEIFYSCQGEGYHIGVPTLWLRTTVCSLQCRGFGQQFPTKPETWIKPLDTFDINTVKILKELPTEAYSVGCDSAYSWDPKFKHLVPEWTVMEIYNEFSKLMNNDMVDVLNGKVHIAFTGGEPLLPNNQKLIANVLDELVADNEAHLCITFETNGTSTFKEDKADSYWTPELSEWLFGDKRRHIHQLSISSSPKLWTVAGEKREKAIKPWVIKKLREAAHQPQDVFYMKFVMGKEPEQVQDLEECIEILTSEAAGGSLNDDKEFVYLMPLGYSSDIVKNHARTVAEYALSKKYRYSDRLHTHIWGNEMGT